MNDPAMRLLVAVVNDAGKLDEILAGFLELGVTGATILNSEGMGRLLASEIPIFAGLQSLVAGSPPQNRMILTVVSAERIDAMLTLLQDACGDLEAPATGIAFVLPVLRVVGLAPELGSHPGHV